MRGTRTWTAIVATTALVFTLAACGGGDDAATEDATVTDAPTAALDTDVQDAVQVIDACQKYFAFDLKMSEMAGAEDAKKKKKARHLG